MNADLLVIDGPMTAAPVGLPALTGRIRVVCSYCRQPYKFTPCIPEMDGEESHGVCDACRPEVFATWATGLAALGAHEERKENQ